MWGITRFEPWNPRNLEELPHESGGLPRICMQCSETLSHLKAGVPSHSNQDPYLRHHRFDDHLAVPSHAATEKRNSSAQLTFPTVALAVEIATACSSANVWGPAAGNINAASCFLATI